MVAALPYLRTDSDNQRESIILRQSVMQVTEAYVKTVLSSVDACCADDSIEDPLEDEGSLREQMDR
jgi:exportin-7